MRSVDQKFEELEEILREESGAHQALLAKAREVNEAAGKGDLAALRRSTALLDHQMACVGRLEDKRKACCSAIAAGLRLPEKSLRLSTLAGHAPARLRSVFADLGASLKATLSKIAAVNAGNRHLCEAGIRFAQGQLTIILQSSEKYHNYRAGGCRCAGALPIHPFINRTV
jgi:hypothetical protein